MFIYIYNFNKELPERLSSNGLYQQKKYIYGIDFKFLICMLLYEYVTSSEFQILLMK